MSLYRGRLAPTPSGWLHQGHGRTFWKAFERAGQFGGKLVLRIEDLDRPRCQPEFTKGAIEDLRWLGIGWDEGPDCGGDVGPYAQSQRMERYSEVWRYLHAAGVIYPCRQSRKDVAIALTAPHDEPAEPVFPVSLRPALRTGSDATSPQGVNWRFRVPDGEVIRFTDLRFGDVARTAGTDFGDFLVWRKDGFPAYELAVVADDHAMQISEVVRGEDLLTSTARQLLIYRALAWTAPDFYHCELMRDASGKRLAKRDGADALRTLRLAGVSPESLIANWSGQLLRGGLFEPGLHDPTDLGE